MKKYALIIVTLLLMLVSPICVKAVSQDWMNFYSSYFIEEATVKCVYNTKEVTLPFKKMIIEVSNTGIKVYQYSNDTTSNNVSITERGMFRSEGSKYVFDSSTLNGITYKIYDGVSGFDIDNFVNFVYGNSACPSNVYISSNNNNLYFSYPRPANIQYTLDVSHNESSYKSGGLEQYDNPENYSHEDNNDGPEEDPYSDSSGKEASDKYKTIKLSTSLKELNDNGYLYGEKYKEGKINDCVLYQMTKNSDDADRFDQVLTNEGLVRFVFKGGEELYACVVSMKSSSNQASVKSTIKSYLTLKKPIASCAGGGYEPYDIRQIIKEGNMYYAGSVCVYTNKDNGEAEAQTIKDRINNIIESYESNKKNGKVSSVICEICSEMSNVLSDYEAFKQNVGKNSEIEKLIEKLNAINCEEYSDVCFPNTNIDNPIIIDDPSNVDKPVSSDTDFCSELTTVWTIAGVALFLIKVIVPISLIVFASIELVKTITAHKESEIDAVRSKLFRKVIAAVAIFLIIEVMSLAISFVTSDTSWSSCANCVFHPFTGEGCGIKKVNQVSTRCGKTLTGNNGITATYTCSNGVGTISSCFVNYNGTDVKCNGGTQNKGFSYLCTLSSSTAANIGVVCNSTYYDSLKSGTTYGGGLPATITDCNC